MIAAHNLTVDFSGDPLFRGVSFVVNPGDRVGLVGSNGAGKTTLMRVLMGIITPDEGRVVKSGGSTIGYLPQESVLDSNETVREEAMKAFDEIHALERRMHELSDLIALNHDAPSGKLQPLLDELGDVQHRFEIIGGFGVEGEAEKILMGLGFKVEDLDRPCGEFSGGWKMRIELAKLLLRAPDLLMLDEPTNHLDIESLTWIESFLQSYRGGILLISHDRAFLDNLTNKTFELSNRRLTAYDGNYSRYLEERAKRRELQQSAYDNQQKMIADTQKFIDRFRYKATKANQVQSRVKALDKLEIVDEPEPDEGSIHFAFPMAPRGGRTAVELEHITKWYGDNLVLKDVDFVLERGEKVAFLGRNGEGKSTLSRIMAGIEPFEGKMTNGHGAVIGYFAQNQAEALNPKRTVLETLDDVAVGDIRSQLRSLLGAFLFQGDDVFKPVSVLSGGEKSRLALAKLLLEPRNVLILDEPTNHLDMASKSVLKKALQKFEGAIVVVSHDRDFLRDLVGKCIEFRDRRIKEHLGGIDDYLRRMQAESVDQVFSAPTAKAKSQLQSGGPSRPSSPAPKNGDDSANRKEQKRLEAELRNKRYSATKDLRKNIDKVEKKVTALETEKEDVSGKLADPDVYAAADRVVTLSKRLSEIDAELAKLYAEWERLAAALEQAEQEIG